MLAVEATKKFISEALAVLREGHNQRSSGRLRTETPQKKYRPESRQNHNAGTPKSRRKMAYASRKINRQRAVKGKTH